MQKLDKIPNQQPDKVQIISAVSELAKDEVSTKRELKQLELKLKTEETLAEQANVALKAQDRLRPGHTMG
ncbi:MAG: hypothetical protein ACD_45C00583G0001 [uncultured bacterium]|nr:MAG: hypothetical protein ACD_45C00583G0001 [uncultured bacterium]